MTVDIDRVLTELRKGRPIVMPTDTVYGIAALPHVSGAVQAIFEAKGRPEDKPLPVLAATAADLAEIVVLDDAALKLAEAFWPGPLTLVLRRQPSFEYDLGPSEPTIAVRIPASDVAREILSSSGPLAVTSANRSGEPPARTIEEARVAFAGHVDVFVDGGVCSGEPSTVAVVEGGVRVLRAGGIGQGAIEDVLASSP